MLGIQIGDITRLCNCEQHPMSSSEEPHITDPSTYTSKDLLLLTQLLHTSGLIDPDAVRTSDLLDDIGQKWYEHQALQLSIKMNECPLREPPSGKDILALYEKLLENFPKCHNTTDLANYFYFTRIAELEDRIAKDKATFKSLLDPV